MGGEGDRLLYFFEENMFVFMINIMDFIDDFSKNYIIYLGDYMAIERG